MEKAGSGDQRELFLILNKTWKGQFDRKQTLSYLQHQNGLETWEEPLKTSHCHPPINLPLPLRKKSQVFLSSPSQVFMNTSH